MAAVMPQHTMGGSSEPAYPQFQNNAVIVDGSHGGVTAVAGHGQQAGSVAAKSGGTGMCVKVMVATVALVVIAGAAVAVVVAVGAGADDDGGKAATSTMTFTVRRAFVDSRDSDGSASRRRLFNNIAYGGAIDLGAGTGGELESLALFVREVYMCRRVACDGSIEGDSPLTGAQDVCTIGTLSVGHVFESECVSIYKNPHNDEVAGNGEPAEQQCTDAANAHASGWMVDFAKGEAESKLTGDIHITEANSGEYRYAVFRAHAYWRMNATVHLGGDDVDLDVVTRKCGPDVCGSECFGLQDFRDCTVDPVEFRMRGGDRNSRCSYNMTAGTSEPVYYRASMAGDLVYRFAAPVVASTTNGNLTVDFAYSLDGLVYGDLGGRVGKDSADVENHDGVTDGAYGIHNYPLGIVPIARSATQRVLKYSYHVRVSPQCRVVPGHPCTRGTAANVCSTPRFGGGPNDNCDPAAGNGESCRPIDVGINATGMRPLSTFDVVVDVYYVVEDGVTQAPDLSAIHGVTITPRRAIGDGSEFKLPFRAMAGEDIRTSVGAGGQLQLSIGNFGRWGRLATVTNMTLMQLVGIPPASSNTEVLLEGIPIVHRRCGPTDSPDYDRWISTVDPDYPVDATGSPGGVTQSQGGGDTNWPFSNCQESEMYFQCPHQLASIVALSTEGEEAPEEVATLPTCNAIRGQDSAALGDLPNIVDFASARSDRFLMDFPILNGHPYPGEGDPPTFPASVKPHDGIHIYPGNLNGEYSGEPHNYPKIYAPFDGYIKAGGVSFYESPLGWSGYNVDYVFAQDDTGREVSINIQIEPQVYRNFSFYQTFMVANETKVVCKGDVLAYFYLPNGACDRVAGTPTCPAAHIHADLKGAGKAPAIWTQEVVDEFHASWNNRFSVDNLSGPGQLPWDDPSWETFPPCIGYRVAPSENPFGTGYQECL